VVGERLQPWMERSDEPAVGVKVLVKVIGRVDPVDHPFPTAKSSWVFQSTLKELLEGA